MSGLGHKQTFGEHKRMSAYPPKADFRATRRHPLWAKNRLTQHNNSLNYESVLEDLSPLHDHQEVLVRIGDEVQVGDGVAVNQQQICQGTSLNEADLTWIGIARP